MPTPDAHPVDLITAAACRIRILQRLLCGMNPDGQHSLDAQDINGLYFILEDIYEPITQAARQLEDAAN